MSDSDITLANLFAAQLGAWGQIASCLISACGLAFVGLQINASNKNNDLQSLYSFFERATALEREISAANEGQSRTAVIHDFLNFLEISAEAIEKGLYGKTSRSIAERKLRDVLAIVWENVEIHRIVESSITSGDTYSGLAAFIRRHRKAIEKVKSA